MFIDDKLFTICNSAILRIKGTCWKLWGSQGSSRIVSRNSHESLIVSSAADSTSLVRGKLRSDWSGIFRGVSGRQFIICDRNRETSLATLPWFMLVLATRKISTWKVVKIEEKHIPGHFQGSAASMGYLPLWERQLGSSGGLSAQTSKPFDLRIGAMPTCYAFTRALKWPAQFSFKSPDFWIWDVLEEEVSEIKTISFNLWRSH